MSEKNFKLLRAADVMKRLGLRRAAFYQLATDESFPRRLQISGPRSVVWVEAEIDRWVEERIKASRETTA